MKIYNTPFLIFAAGDLLKDESFYRSMNLEEKFLYCRQIVEELGNSHYESKNSREEYDNLYKYMRQAQYI